VLVLASDLSNAWNDFAVHPAFVPFVHDVVAYAAASGAVPRELVVGARPDATAPGVVQAGGARIAVNVDPAEAERARMSPSAFAAAVPRSDDAEVHPQAQTAVRREREQALWRYGLMVMLAALVLESAIGRKV
jgi:hypothetical protein